MSPSQVVFDFIQAGLLEIYDELLLLSVLCDDVETNWKGKRYNDQHPYRRRNSRSAKQVRLQTVHGSNLVIWR